MVLLNKPLSIINDNVLVLPKPEFNWSQEKGRIFTGIENNLQ